MSKKVIVSDISGTASEKTVKDFFLFCGKIKEFELIKEESSDKQIAYITFERETAAKTALMLTNAVIGDSQITVKSADECGNGDCGEVYSDGGEAFEGQEGKSKLLIFAELLAAGYQLQDVIFKKGAEFDAKYGLSSILKQYLSVIQTNLLAIDDKYKVTDTVTAKALELDTKYSVKDKISYTVTQAHDRALDSSTGKLVLDLYTNATKQVSDINCLAKRIVNERRASTQPDNTIEAH